MESYQWENGTTTPFPKNNFQERAENTMTSRLLSCIVNAKLMAAIIKPLDKFIGTQSQCVQEIESARQWCLIYNEKNSDMLLFPLRAPPLQDNFGKVTLLDPEDFDFPIYHGINNNWTSLKNPAATIMKLIQSCIPEFDPQRVQQIIDELESSIEHQAYAYSIETQIQLPKLGDSCMAWEQSVTEGHPTHPMNRSRYAVPPLKKIAVEADLVQPLINFVAVPKKEFRVWGPFIEIMNSSIGGKLKGTFDPATEFVLPVHSYQLPKVQSSFPYAKVLKYSEKAEACLNVRTVQIPSIPGYHFKLPLGVIITGGIRTVGLYATEVGRRLGRIVDAVVEDKELLVVIRDVASVFPNHPDLEVAKHLSCVIREDPETVGQRLNERLVVCVALLERNVNHEFVVNRALQLDTTEKRWQFFQRYTKLFLRAMLPPLLKFGLCFESHPQNTLVRFKKNDSNSEYELVGFAIRDFDGIEFQRETLMTTTGLYIEFQPRRPQYTIESLHVEAFHAIFQSNLYRFVRALGFHCTGEGWSFIRKTLNELLPSPSLTRELWLNRNTTLCKSFLDMKLRGMYVEAFYCQLPNLLLLRNSRQDLF